MSTSCMTWRAISARRSTVVIAVLCLGLVGICTYSAIVVLLIVFKDDTVGGPPSIDFEGFDNVSGSAVPIVPDVVHYIKFRSDELDFIEMLSIRSVQVNHRPQRIIIHCDVCSEDGGLRGERWNYVQSFEPRVEVRRMAEPTHVFGKWLNSVHHASDVARIVILREYGGIYLDGDVFVVRSMHRFLHYECAVGWPVGQFIGNQVLVAHAKSRFLTEWLDSYRYYRPFMWYYNAGELPTESILAVKPELIHRVTADEFGVGFLVDQLYKTVDWPEWRRFYAIHLLSRHRSYLDADSPIERFDEQNIKTYNFTFGRMARSVLYSTTELIVD